MTASQASSHFDADAIMAAATTANRSPDAAMLTRALLLEEKSAKGQPVDTQALEGTWQLRFTVPKRPRLQNGQPTQRGFYIPSVVKAEIGFQSRADATPLAIHNRLKIGPLAVLFTGNAKPVGKQIVAFEFTQLTVTLAQIPLYRGQVRTAPLPAENRTGKAAFFGFFATTRHYVAARGRGGGLAFWIRSSPAPDL